MKLEILQSAKTEAMKNKDAIRKEAISAMIDAVQKASITPKGRTLWDLSSRTRGSPTHCLGRAES